MKFKVEKNGSVVNFVDVATKNRFDYIEFADKLYNGEKIEIASYKNVSDDEKKIIDQTIQELNDLANPRKRKKIIAQLDSDQ